MDEFNAFFSFINELRSLPLFPLCYNNQKNFQSSVAIIFRVNPEFCLIEHKEAIQKENSSPISIETLKNMLEGCFQNRKEKEKRNRAINENASTILPSFLQILFIRRSLSDKDIHSGQIALPGGKSEDSENDYEASIRETKEEVGLNLKENSAYLGKLAENFFVYPTRRGILHLTINLFFQVKDEKILFNKSEVQHCKWVDWRELVFPKEENLVFKKVQSNANILRFVPKIIIPVLEYFLKNVECFKFPGIDIEMEEYLYGLTFYIFMYIFHMVKIKEGEISNENMRRLENVKRFSRIVDVQFKTKRISNFLTDFVIQKIYNRKRIKRFTYMRKRVNKRELKIYYIAIVLIIILICKFLA